jgi:hypothetical protein
MTDERSRNWTPSLIAGIACTATALAGSTFFIALMAGYLPGELAEIADKIAVGMIGIVIAASSLWLFVRWLNRRDSSTRLERPNGLVGNTRKLRSMAGMVVFALVILFIVIAAAYLLVTPRTAAPTNEELDICEAIFLFELSEARRIPLAEEGICLEVHGLNPPTSLLRRLQRHEPRAKHRAEFRDGLNVLVQFGKIHRTSADTAEAFASLYVAADFGWGRTYFLVRNDGKWTVPRAQLQWVS